MAHRRPNLNAVRHGGRRLAVDLLRACLIVAIAGFGAVIVRNVTDVLMLISHHDAPVAVAEWPRR